MPECPKEATGLLSKYDAYYLGDTNEKVVYLTFDEGYENGFFQTVDCIQNVSEVSMITPNLTSEGRLF